MGCNCGKKKKALYSSVEAKKLARGETTEAQQKTVSQNQATDAQQAETYGTMASELSASAGNVKGN